MTKSYQIKTYLIDCLGYSWEELDCYNLEGLLDLVEDKGDCAAFLEVPLDYLK
jgi:hypothetical protein